MPLIAMLVAAILLSLFWILDAVSAAVPNIPSLAAFLEFIGIISDAAIVSAVFVMLYHISSRAMSIAKDQGYTGPKPAHVAQHIITAILLFISIITAIAVAAVYGSLANVSGSGSLLTMIRVYYGIFHVWSVVFILLGVNLLVSCILMNRRLKAMNMDTKGISLIMRGIAPVLLIWAIEQFVSDIISSVEFNRTLGQNSDINTGALSIFSTLLHGICMFTIIAIYFFLPKRLAPYNTATASTKHYPQTVFNPQPHMSFQQPYNQGYPQPMSDPQGSFPPANGMQGYPQPMSSPQAYPHHMPHSPQQYPQHQQLNGHLGYPQAIHSPQPQQARPTNPEINNVSGNPYLTSNTTPPQPMP